MKKILAVAVLVILSLSVWGSPQANAACAIAAKRWNGAWAWWITWNMGSTESAKAQAKAKCEETYNDGQPCDIKIAHRGPGWGAVAAIPNGKVCSRAGYATREQAVSSALERTGSAGELKNVWFDEMEGVGQNETY